MAFFHTIPELGFLPFCGCATLWGLGVLFLQWEVGRKWKKVHTLLTAVALKGYFRSYSTSKSRITRFLGPGNSPSLIVIRLLSPPLLGNHFNSPKCRRDWEISSWLGSHLLPSEHFWNRMNIFGICASAATCLWLKIDILSISGQVQSDLSMWSFMIYKKPFIYIRVFEWDKNHKNQILFSFYLWSS